MINVYGHPASTCTRKVLFMLNEANASYQLNLVDFAKGEHKQPAHLAHQPFGQLPAIDDDGFGLYESRAIMRYLDQKFAVGLTPKELKAHALMEQWISVESANITPKLMTLIYQLVFNPMFGQPVDDAVVTAGIAALHTVLPIMEAQLSKTAYLAGTAMTLADAGYLPYLEYVMQTSAKVELAKYPHLMAWWTRCSERPAWRKAVGRA